MSDENAEVNVDPTLAGATVITDDMLAAAEEATKAADAKNRGETPDDQKADDEAPSDDKTEDKADDTADETKTPDDLEIPDKDEKSESKDDEGGEGELIDIASFAEEFASEDGPSEETMTTLRDALGSKFANADELIDTFRAGQAALRALAQTAAHEIVGGGENYGAMIEWASENMSDAERNGFNEAVKGPGRDLAIRGLYAQFTEATGHGSGDADDVDTSHITSGTAVTGGIKPLVSIQEISKLTADPRFDTDPAFRRDVERRIAAGNKQRG